jgi:hypothetical protein
MARPKIAIGIAALAVWWFIIVLPANMPEVRFPGAWPQGRTAIIIGPLASSSECNREAQSVKRRFPAIEIQSCFEADSIRTTMPPDLAPSEPLGP